MNLNLPDVEALRRPCKYLLLGVGGGYDHLGTLPIAYTYRKYNAVVYSIDIAKEFGRTGVQPILKRLRELVADEKIECVIGVDGGVDALMRGDEQDGGTLLEDSVVLAAIAQLNVPYKVLACMGFGTEAEEGLCHYRALENIAALAAAGGFLGSCSLTPEMECFQYYKEGCEKEWEGKRKSHIHTRIIPAVLGQFDDQNLYEGVDARVHNSTGMKAFVNPLMGMYWFFNLMKVYERSLLAKYLVPTATSTDALMVYRQLLPELMKNERKSKKIPL